MKKVISVLIAVMLVVSAFVACDKKNDDNELAATKLVPQNKESIESTINNYRPDKGYTFDTSSNILDDDENLFYLTQETSSNIIGNVYISPTDDNAVEIDIYTKDCNDDDDLKSAINMAVSTINAVYPDFKISKFDDYPFNLKKIKDLIKDNKQQSDCIYDEVDLNKSVSYEYFPEDGLLTYFVAY